MNTLSTAVQLQYATHRRSLGFCGLKGTWAANPSQAWGIPECDRIGRKCPRRARTKAPSPLVRWFLVIAFEAMTTLCFVRDDLGLTDMPLQSEQEQSCPTSTTAQMDHTLTRVAAH